MFDEDKDDYVNIINKAMEAVQSVDMNYMKK